MKIITSLYVYNFHLIISYLSEGIRIIRFLDHRNRFFKSGAEYSQRLDAGNGMIEMQGTHHILYGTQNSSLVSLNLIEGKPQKKSPYEIPINDITQLAISYKTRDLFAFSSTKGFLEIELSSKNESAIIGELIPNFLQKMDLPVISNLQALENDLLVSIRNYGVVTIPKNFRKKDNYNTLKEYRFEDPQDARIIRQLDLIAVADGKKGVLLFDASSKEIQKAFTLPNQDIPQQIERVYTYLIIKGAYGLYSYDYKLDHLSILVEGKIGALVTYYDYIFFSKKGKVYTMIMKDTFEQHGFKFPNQQDQIEIQKESYKGKPLQL